jgi:phosphonate transport system substrate-binding protein
VFFVRRDSPVTRLEDLRGRTLAMQSVLSTSAYLVPAMTLLDHGVQPEILLSPKDVPAADSVGYVFARSELNISTYVHKRLVDAGVISNLDWEDARSVPPAFRTDLRVIHRSEPLPRALEMVRRDLDPVVRRRLQEVLLEASRDPQAKVALHKFFGTTGFHAVDPANQRALARLRAGLVRVRMEVE